MNMSRESSSKSLQNCNLLLKTVFLKSADKTTYINGFSKLILRPLNEARTTSSEQF